MFRIWCSQLGQGSTPLQLLTLWRNCNCKTEYLFTAVWRSQMTTATWMNTAASLGWFSIYERVKSHSLEEANNREEVCSQINADEHPHLRELLIVPRLQNLYLRRGWHRKELCRCSLTSTQSITLLKTKVPGIKERPLPSREILISNSDWHSDKS